jgi:hypothetical protein
VQEAKQAVELIGKWETIDVADALELLSPDFKSEEVSYLGSLSVLLFCLDVCVSFFLYHFIFIEPYICHPSVK